jgi:multiple sugar transport system substrate-binding protein
MSPVRPKQHRGGHLGLPRPRAAAAAVAVCLATMAAACVGGGGGSGGSGNLVLEELDPYTEKLDGQVTQRVLTECGKQAGVSIEREAVPSEQMIPQVLQQASAGSLPDLMLLDNLYVQQIAETGALTSFDTFGFKGEEEFYPGVISAGTYKGKLYGLPSGVDTLALYYNKEMFKDAGISPPKDWSELTEAATELTQGSTYGIAFSAIATEEGTFQFLPFYWSAGADLTKLNSPEAVKALELWTDLVQQKAASRGTLNWDQAEVTDQFLAGNAAMMVNGPWALAELTAQKDIKYGVVRIPPPSQGMKTTVPLGGEVWVIPASDEERQQKAWQVLECMNTSKYQLMWNRKTAHLPSKPTIADEMKNPIMASFADALPGTRPRTFELGPNYPDASKQVWTAVQAALAGSASPQEALDQAERRMGSGS